MVGVAESKTQSIPLNNRGIVQKVDPGLLQPGQFQNLLNMTSIQEGGLVTRNGSKKFANAGAMQLVHSAAKLAVGADAAAPRYFGEGSSIQRITGPYTTLTNLASGLSLSTDPWEAASLDSEGSGNPILYLAHKSRMMRDNGSFTRLRAWGITRPSRPVTAVAADPTLGGGLVVLTDHSSGGTNRLGAVTVSSVVTVSTNYYRATLSDTSDILPGTYLHFSGSANTMLVDQVVGNIVIGRASASPSGSVSAHYSPVILPATPTIADGSAYSFTFTGSADWALNGVEQNNYDHNDLIHVGLYIDGATYISEIRIRIFLGGSSSDYYEKSIAPSPAQDFASGTTSAGLTEAEIIAALNNGDISTEQAEQLLNEIRAVSIPPTVAPTWYEFNISKLEFLKVGNAGNGAYTWKNVTGAQAYVISNDIDGDPTFVVRVGAIYAVGGQGPDTSEETGGSPYDWLYTFRDPITGAEGNPCAVMLTEKFLDLKNRAAQITVYGVSTDDALGNPAIAGFGSIAIYRRGGAFADGLYRFVGYSTNAELSGGVPQPSTFVDNTRDEDIADARTIEFDNDPPVTSRPVVPMAATISALSATGPDAYSQVTLTGLPGGGALSTFVSIGSIVHVGQAGKNLEDCVVQDVIDSPGYITVFLQNTHAAGEQVTCETFSGRPCDIVCAAGQRLLVAGDPANPSMVYMSKSGRPHAFPLLTLATGNVNQQIIGSPDNPINGLAEYNGEYVSLNKARIYTFSIISGQMTRPNEMPVTQGLTVKHAWCKDGSKIYYLSYDGIYAWAGGGSAKVTGAIDWVFRGQDVGALKALDYSQTTFIQLFPFQGRIYFLYKDNLGANRCLRYSPSEDRWEPLVYASALTRGLVEEDTGRLIGAIFSSGESKTSVHQLELGTSDGYTTLVSDGSNIDFIAKTGFMSPEDKIRQILLTELVIELKNPDDAVTVKVFYDFSDTADATDQFTIPAGATRRRVPLPLQQSGGLAHGKQCNSFAIEFSGSANQAVNLYSLGMKHIPLADIQRGAITDWDDLGHPYDKRIYTVEIEYNTHGSAATIALDTIIGTGQGSQSLSVQTLTLDATSQRGKKTFGITSEIVAKMVRLRPTVSSVDFEIHQVIWGKEDYPPDAVYFTPYDNCGTPFDKYAQQLVLDVNTNGQIVPVTIEVDGAAAQTFNVQSTLNTRGQTKTISPAILGKKFRITVGTIPAFGMFQLFECKFVTQPADGGAVSHTTDWDALDHPFDKRLQTLTVFYDNKSQGSITLLVDTLTGIAGGTPNPAAMSFVLSATGRGQQTFAIPDGQIVKSVRVRPSSNNVQFQMWKYFFQKEDFPADSIAFTAWDDFGYEHDKLIQEIMFDVDTGGVAASVQVQSDGGALQTISINSTGSTREVAYTLNPALNGKKFRLLITPGSGGKFQLWKWVPKFIKGDRGPVEHSFDWDDLGSPYDKKLINVTFEYDMVGGGPVTMVMDKIGGISGTAISLATQSFVLTGTGRSKETFSMALDTVAKMIRIRPSSTFQGFKSWKYEFSKIAYPPDKIPATENDDLGYACEKILRSFEVDLDTGGVAASLQLQVDGVNTGSAYSVTTSTNDRVRILTAPANTIGKLFRIVPTAGGGGKAQIFKVHYDAIREPCCVNRIDTFEISLGGAGYKFIKQIWLEYLCAGSVTLTVYGDAGVVIHTESLPLHLLRDVERFYLYDVLNGVPNKSKMHRIVITPDNPSNCLKLYGDSSRIEVLQLSGDQRQAYDQKYLSTLTSPQVNT